MKSDVVVATVSGPLVCGDKDANLATMERALEGPAAEADLVVYSEANINGGFWKDGEKDYPCLAESVPDGPSCRRAIDMARRHRKTICCGLLERAEGKLFITHLLCGPDGLVGVQRKLYTEPGGAFASGERVNVLECLGQRCLILACADILLPEGPIVAALQRPSLVLAPTDCLHVSQEGLIRRLLPVRAMDAGAAVLAAFGHDGTRKDRRVLAGAMVRANGQFAALECREADEVRVMCANLEIGKPRQGWAEGMRARAEILRQHL